MKPENASPLSAAHPLRPRPIAGPAEQNPSIRTQPNALKKISGTKAKRPGLDQMMTDARRGRFDIVLVWASDRIARSVKHFLDVLDKLSHLNVEYVSFRENIDTGGPLGRAIIIIVGAVIGAFSVHICRRSR